MCATGGKADMVGHSLARPLLTQSGLLPRNSAGGGHRFARALRRYAAIAEQCLFLRDGQLVVARLGQLCRSSRKVVLPCKIVKAVKARFCMRGLYSVVRFFSMDCPVNGV